jgi:hypothetical protein
MTEQESGPLHNSKWAVWALSTPKFSLPSSGRIDLGDGFFVSTSLPFAFAERWQTRLGTDDVTRIQGAGLYLNCIEQSAEPLLTDSESERLRTRIWRFYVGLLIAAPFLRHGTPTLLVGATEDGELILRRHYQYDAVPDTVGATPVTLSPRQFRHAKEFAQTVEAVETQNASPRFMRALRT